MILKRDWKWYIGVYLILAFLIWLSEFLYFWQFGIYEDDFTRIPSAMAWSWSDFFHQAWWLLSNFYGQGRPIQPILVDFFSRLAGGLGNYHSLYIFGFLNLTIVAFLFYTVMDRILPRKAALLSAIAFVLYPADTTQPFLYHSLGLYPSLSFFFVACHFYLSRKPVPAYAMLILSLLTYETIVPVFIAIPIFSFEWTRNWRREFLVNAVIVAVLLAGAFGLRTLTGEKRVLEMGFNELLTTPFVHMMQGPVVSLGTFAYRPYQVIANISLDLFLVIVIAFIFLFALLRRQVFEQEMDDYSFLPLLKGKRSLRSLSPGLKQQLIHLVAGFVMLVLAYALTYTVRAYAITGRDTRVHLSAVVGASVVAGTVFSLFLYSFEKTPARNLGKSLVALLLAMLAGFSVYVQKDYVTSWRYQQAFWGDVVELCSDVESGTVILVDPDGIADTRQIAANTWNLPRILNQLYNFPEEWEPPRVYRLAEDWEDRILTTDGQMQLNAATTIAPPSLYRSVAPEEVILLAYVNGQLTRREAELVLPSLNVGLRQPGESVLALQPKGILYDLMLEGEG